MVTPDSMRQVEILSGNGMVKGQYRIATVAVAGKPCRNPTMKCASGIRLPQHSFTQQPLQRRGKHKLLPTVDIAPLEKSRPFHDPHRVQCTGVPGFREIA